MSTVLSHFEPNGVLTLTLNRPELHNAFNEELTDCLAETLAAAGTNPEVRLVVLTGSGKSFSAGADLNWMRSMSEASAHDNEHDALALARLMRTLNYLPKPTIAQVNGAAFGGGVGLIACCDIAIAASHAQFALTECRLGLAPAVISPYLYRRIGEAHSRRYFLSAERFDAGQARHIGLVHEQVAAAELDGAVARLSTELLKSGPSAAGHCKNLVFHAAGHSADQQLELDQHTARLIAGLRVSGEGQEGMQAFLQKRPAAWCDNDN